MDRKVYKGIRSDYENTYIYRGVKFTRCRGVPNGYYGAYVVGFYYYEYRRQVLAHIDKLKEREEKEEKRNE